MIREKVETKVLPSGTIEKRLEYRGREILMINRQRGLLSLGWKAFMNASRHPEHEDWKPLEIDRTFRLEKAVGLAKAVIRKLESR